MFYFIPIISYEEQARCTYQEFSDGMNFYFILFIWLAWYSVFSCVSEQ